MMCYYLNVQLQGQRVKLISLYVSNMCCYVKYNWCIATITVSTQRCHTIEHQTNRLI